MNELLTLAKQVLQVVTPILKNKVFQQIGNDFSEALTNEGLALWQKIKPVFIQEDEKKALLQLEEKPADSQAQEEFQFFLVNKLRQEPSLKQEIETLLANSKALQASQVNMQHFGHGDQFVGNKYVGYSPPPQ